MHLNPTRQHEQTAGFPMPQSASMPGSESHENPDETDATPADFGFELAPEGGGSGGKSNVPVEVLADDEDHPSFDESDGEIDDAEVLLDDEDEDDEEHSGEATEPEEPSTSDGSHLNSEFDDDHFEKMGAEYSERALDELEVDCDRDDGNEDRPGT